MKTLLLLLGSLVLSLTVGAGIGALAMSTLPCRWFGTAFEGACAYGVLWASIALGLLAAVLSFGVFAYRVVRRRPAAPGLSGA